MQIPGFPLDIYSLLGFASTAFLIYLGFLQLSKYTDSNNFVQENVHLDRVQRDAHADVDHHRDQDQMSSTTSASSHICLSCGDGRANIRCSRCKVARYCSGTCQIKHWRAGHKLECKEYKSPANVDSASDVGSEGRGTSHMGTSSSDHRRDREQMPSTSASPYVCLFCGNGRADIRCARCKVAGYCSGTCQIKHWRAGHKLECKEYKSPADVDSASSVGNEGRGTSHMGISDADHYIDRGQMPSTSASPYICWFCDGRRPDICLICTSDVGLSSSDHHRDRDQMPSTSSPYCLFCGDGRADIRCARCQVARYCSGTCQIKHWRAGHKLECKEYKSPANVDSASDVGSEGRGTSHMGTSSSDHRRDREQMPSTSASPYVCLFCGNGRADIRCAICKVAGYCSGTCQIKHWRAGHKLECKEYKSPADVDSASSVGNEGRGTSHMNISDADHHIDQVQMPSTSANPYICWFCDGRRPDICLICTSDVGLSSSDHHRDRDQMPSTSSPYCLFCGDGRADIRCARCQVARYCSQKCQIKHWRAGHRLECKVYKSPSNVDSASAVSCESRGSDHVGISSSDHHRDRDQMPSAPASRDFCFVCGDWSDIRCSRCKVVRYCSQACETKHWREGHKLECKENKSPANVYSASAVSSERRGSGHVGTLSSEYQQSKKDVQLADTVQSPKRTSSKELPSVEECPICFSTIHTSEPSCSLLACDICKHKFHSTCLLKWFSTSNKSHCPLCQSPFKSEGAAV